MQSLPVNPSFSLPALFICLPSFIISLSLVSHSAITDKIQQIALIFFRAPVSVLLLSLAPPNNKNKLFQEANRFNFRFNFSWFACFVPVRVPLPCACISTTSIFLLPVHSILPDKIQNHFTFHTYVVTCFVMCSHILLSPVFLFGERHCGYFILSLPFLPSPAADPTKPKRLLKHAKSFFFET